MNQAQGLQNRVQQVLEHKTPSVALQKKAYTFCVTSGKGGVGKTSFSVNFALSLAKCNKKVLLIDGDFGFSNVNIVIGKTAEYSLEHVVRGEKSLVEVMESCYDNVWYISGGSGASELIALQDESMAAILSQVQEIEQTMDYIIFDTGAGINSNILRMIEAADSTILVMTPEPTSIVDSFVIVKTSQELEEKPKISAMVNKVYSEKDALSTFDNFSNVVRKHLQYEVDMLGYVVNDSKMSEAITSMVPYVVKNPNTYTANQYQKIANKITQSPPQKEAKGLKNFFARLIKRAK